MTLPNFKGVRFTQKERDDFLNDFADYDKESLCTLITEINLMFNTWTHRSGISLYSDRFRLFVYLEQKNILDQRFGEGSWEQSFFRDTETKVQFEPQMGLVGEENGLGTPVSEGKSEKMTAGVPEKKKSTIDPNMDIESFLKKVLKFFHREHYERMKNALLSHIDGGQIKIRDQHISFHDFYSLVSFEYQDANKERTTLEPLYLGSTLFEKFLNGELNSRDLFADGEVSPGLHKKLSSEKPNLDSIERNML